ncbi:hypothetical protein FHX42_003641 [Saccharopolyspora lacisalsi]|uniref:Uncharacterized protein n=1 Tax=Halosaccharopolyspora lacisalsi TaxID=1000566 RepID=A0A839E3D2_9PSEU|nr:hypothetical protein [Halosaccharopolyspora lacisalsi]MBA8826265.1 hypothetical protein [Halosaccharopolyspora lacisalsi]
MRKKTWLFVISLVGMAASAAVLILFIPSLFRSGEQGDVWAVGVLACLTVAFAVGARYWRPSTSISDGR